MTGWLASVANEAEIALVRPARPDILDLKNPADGALGAWPVERVAAVVRSLADIPGRPRLSATIGDLPMEPATVLAAACAMAGTGVDFVKVGIAPDGDPLGCLDALGALADEGAELIAVFFADLWADLQPDSPPVTAAARAGFKGVMLDTATKSRNLCSHRNPGRLAMFVGEARALGLVSGLAGSLRVSDIPSLRAVGADYLGFRGALCGIRDRTRAIDPESVERVSIAMAAPIGPPEPGAPHDPRYGGSRVGQPA
jgi:uncharacterized protein (UPF0264 family)